MIARYTLEVGPETEDGEQIQLSVRAQVQQEVPEGISAETVLAEFAAHLAAPLEQKVEE